MKPEEFTKLFKELKFTDTLTLFLLSSMTSSIYATYYISRQSKVLNKNIETPDTFLCYLGYFLFIGSLSWFVMAGFILLGKVKILVTIYDVLVNLLLLSWFLWAFLASRKLDRILKDMAQYPLNVNWICAIIFSPYYFNYKINQINAYPFEPNKLKSE